MNTPSPNCSVLSRGRSAFFSAPPAILQLAFAVVASSPMGMPARQLGIHLPAVKNNLRTIFSLKFCQLSCYNNLFVIIMIHCMYI